MPLKALLDKMPAQVRREILRNLGTDDASAVREAITAAERTARQTEPIDRSGWWTNPDNK